MVAHTVTKQAFRTVAINCAATVLHLPDSIYHSYGCDGPRVSPRSNANFCYNSFHIGLLTVSKSIFVLLVSTVRALSIILLNKSYFDTSTVMAERSRHSAESLTCDVSCYHMGNFS